MVVVEKNGGYDEGETGWGSPAMRLDETWDEPKI